MDQFCNNCGVPVNPDSRFCPSCGGEIIKGIVPGGEAIVSGPVESAAPGYAGAGSNIGLLLSDSLKKLLKNPKQLIPVVALALFWLVLSLLPSLSINPWPVRFLSFLTFAQGGMYGGAVGALGGIIGKAVFAYFFSALIVPLFYGKNPFKVMAFKGLFAGMALQGVNAAAELMLGLGLALVLFNFFTGNASPVNSMAGIVGVLLALKALFSRGDLLRNLALIAANKLSGGKTPKPLTVNRVIAGYGAGSALSVLLSLVPLPYLAYILGAILFVAGLVISITAKPGKTVPAA